SINAKFAAGDLVRGKLGKKITLLNNNIMKPAGPQGAEMSFPINSLDKYLPTKLKQTKAKKIAMNNKEIKSWDLIFIAWRALLGEIRPNMRSIFIDYKKEEDKISVDFFYDTPPSEEDKNYDVEGTIIAEMISEYPDKVWEHKSHIVPYPQ